MTPHFHVVMVRHQTGERIPILLDEDRQPITWINMYLLLRLWPRLASSSQEKALYVLGLFWVWCSMQTIPVRERLESGDGLTPEEIVSRLYPWLRRSFQSNGSVRHLVVFTEYGDLSYAGHIAVHHLASRERDGQVAGRQRRDRAYPRQASGPASDLRYDGNCANRTARTRHRAEQRRACVSG